MNERVAVMGDPVEAALLRLSLKDEVVIRGRGPNVSDRIVGSRDPRALARRNRLALGCSGEAPAVDNGRRRLRGPARVRATCRRPEVGGTELAPDRVEDTLRVLAGMRAHRFDA